MAEITQARSALVQRIAEGRGEASTADRKSALMRSGLAGPAGALVDKVALHAWKVTDEDVAAVKAAGLNEDQIFEIIVCAAVGQANRQYDAALKALDAATGTR